MTYKEAFSKLSEYCGEEPKVIMCREYSEFFGFYILPKDAAASDRNFVGGEMTCVMKDTGKVILEDDMDDFGFYNERWRFAGDS